MTFKDFLKKANDAVTENPAILDLPVFIFSPEDGELYKMCDSVTIDNSLDDRVDINISADQED